jgi:hypothetical protein
VAHFDLVDLIEAAEELLLPLLVASLEIQIFEMYLKQPQSTNSLEVKAQMQLRRSKHIYFNFVIHDYTSLRILIYSLFQISWNQNGWI